MPDKKIAKSSAGFATVAITSAPAFAAAACMAHAAFSIFGRSWSRRGGRHTLGLAGSEVMAAVRRDRGIEIEMQSLPENERIHGFGLIGRIERMVFAAPVFFHLVRFWWTHVEGRKLSPPPRGGCTILAPHGDHA